MKVMTEVHGNVRVLRIEATRIDSAVASILREIGRTEMTAGPLWLIDLGKVTFMDSSGIGTLVGLLKWMGRERHLELCGMTPAVHNVFRLTRLDAVFRIHEDLAAGIAAHQTDERQPNQ